MKTIDMSFFPGCERQLNDNRSVVFFNEIRVPVFLVESCFVYMRFKVNVLAKGEITL